MTATLAKSPAAHPELKARPLEWLPPAKEKVAGGAGPDDLELKRVRTLAGYMRDFNRATSHDAKARAWVSFVSIETSISATAVRLGLRIVTYIDKKTGIAEVTQEELRAEIGLKERQASSVIKELEAAGLLHVTPGKWKKTKGRYSLTIPEIGRLRDMIRVPKPAPKRSA